MGKSKQHYGVSIYDFYKDYKKQAVNKGYPIRERSKYRSFLYELFDEIFEMVIKNKFHMVLPFSMGDIYMKEWSRHLHGKTYKNPHTLGKTFRIVWDKTYVRFFNKGIYKFRLTRRWRQRARDFYMDEVGSGKERIPEPYNYPLKVPYSFDQ